MKRAIELHERNERLVKLLNEITRELDPSLLSQKAKDKLNEMKMILSTEKQDEQESFAIAAQVSLYPLRVPSLTPFINDVQNTLRELGLTLIPGSMSTVVHGEADKVWLGLQMSFTTCATHGEVVMVLTVSNACPVEGTKISN